MSHCQLHSVGGTLGGRSNCTEGVEAVSQEAHFANSQQACRSLEGGGPMEDLEEVSHKASHHPHQLLVNLHGQLLGTS